jgi:transcriptional regulator with XRE-family HTH domain
MEDKIYRVFGSRLKELREEKKVTQEELARRVDLSRTSITNIEKGRQRIMLHQFVDLADALQADPSELFPSKSTEPDREIRPGVAKLIDALKSEKTSSS